MKTPEEFEAASKDIAQYILDNHSMELHESGALLVSIGIYQIAASIPDLWPQLRNVAILAQQLLNQDANKKKAEALNKTNNETL